MYLKYYLITDKYYEPTNSYQCSCFSQIIRQKEGTVYLYKGNNNKYCYYYYVKKCISEQTGLPIATIVDCCSYSNIYVDINKNYFSYGFNSCTNIINYFGLNDSYNTNRTIYIIIDLYKDPIFQNLNENAKNQE